VDFEQLADDMANHIVKMSKVEGFKDYARQRLKDLSKEPLFSDIVERVKEKLKEQK
jgi:hypothetical protein